MSLNLLVQVSNFQHEYKKLVRTTLAIYLYFTLISYSAEKNPNNYNTHISFVHVQKMNKKKFGGFLNAEKTAIELLRYEL